MKIFDNLQEIWIENSNCFQEKNWQLIEKDFIFNPKIEITGVKIKQDWNQDYIDTIQKSVGSINNVLNVREMNVFSNEIEIRVVQYFFLIFSYLIFSKNIV